MDNQYLSVSALNQYIKARFDRDQQLQQIYIKGEISNYSRHSRGHLYFTLKDENSCISAVMFESYARHIDFEPKDGDKVLIEARVSVYTVKGQYQLYVEKLELEGIGRLFLQFEQLKKKLLEEGLFDDSHKKPIPKYPGKIAVLSAYPSDGLMDVVVTIKQRFPIARVIIFPIPVEGKNAYLKIIETLKYVDTLKFNTIIIARGGGTIEQLWNFNEELLAREIYNCQTPIISAIGHELDYTICDYVSDRRAKTPTEAGIISTPDLSEMTIRLHEQYKQLNMNMKNILNNKKHKYELYENNFIFKNPERLYGDQIQTLIYLEEKLKNNFLNTLKNKKIHYQNTEHIFTSKKDLFAARLNHNIEFQTELLQKNMNTKIKQNEEYFRFLVSKLNALSPLNILERGYSIVQVDNKTIMSVNDIENNDLLDIKMKDGMIHAKAIKE